MIGSGESEEKRADTLHHDGEEDPRAHLVRVVGTRDELEQESERVGRRKRNAALFAARRSQVSQRHVDGEVAQLVEL